MKKVILFFFILLLGLILRFYKLSDYPEGVFIDEASRSYNAYSILKTGKDEYGKSWPLFFESEGEYKLPVHNYISALYFGVFGLSKFSDRALPALAAFLQIPIFCYFLYLIKKSMKFSFLGGFLLAISHWQYNLERLSDTHQLTLVFLLLSICFFTRLIKKNLALNLILTFVFAFLAAFSYRSATVFFPVFLTISLFLFRKLLKNKYKFAYFFLLFLLFFSIVISFKVIMARFNSSGVNAFPEINNILNEQIREDGEKNTVITRFFHNKLINSGKIVARKYWENLDFTFLFFRGDKSLNNSIVNEPNFLYFEIILLFIGSYIFIRKFEKNKLNLIIPLFIFIPGVATSGTVDNPNASRMLISIFGFIYLISLGILYVSTTKIKKIAIVVLLVLYAYFMSYMLHEYFVHKPIHQAWFRNYSIEELVLDLEKYRKEYKRIYFEKPFVTEYMFITGYNPATLQERIRKSQNYNFQTKNMSILYGNYYPNTSKKPCAFIDKKENDLFVCYGNRIPLKSKIIKVYRYRDGQPSYILIEADEKNISTPLPDKVEIFKNI